MPANKIADKTTLGGVGDTEFAALVQEKSRRFDPWWLVESGAAEHEETLRKLALMPVERLLLQMALRIYLRRPATGFEVLQAVRDCAANGLPVPRWLADELVQRVRRVEAFEDQSLDEAFAPLPTPADGEYRPTARLRARWGELLGAMFTPRGSIPRTKVGYDEAAEMLEGRLSSKQIEALLPKRTRKPRVR